MREERLEAGREGGEKKKRRGLKRDRVEERRQIEKKPRKK